MKTISNYDYLIFNVVCRGRLRITDNWSPCEASYVVYDKKMADNLFQFVLVYQIEDPIPNNSTRNKVIKKITSTLRKGSVSIEETKLIPNLKYTEEGTRQNFNWKDVVKVS